MKKSLRKELGYNKYNEILPNRKVKKKDTETKRKVESEIKKYGYPKSDLWSMDATSAIWLLEHLEMYLEIVGEFVDLNYHTFEIPVLIPIENVKNEPIEDVLTESNKVIPKESIEDVLVEPNEVVHDEPNEDVNSQKKAKTNLEEKPDPKSEDVPKQAKFEYKKHYKEKIVTLTQKEAIETAIKYLKFGLMKNKKNYEKMKDIDVEFDSLFEIEDVQMEKLQQAFKIYSIILPAMWW